MYYLDLYLPEEAEYLIEKYGIYNTIIVKDIAQRHKITDTMMLESVTRFIFDNIGKPMMVHLLCSGIKVLERWTQTSFGRQH